MYIDPNIHHPIATKLRQKLKPTVPVDIVKLIRSFSDIAIETVDGLPKEPLVTYANEYYTFIVTNNPTPKERFRIAVDLAHILLGHVVNTYNLYRRNANELMFEANTLGAAILCPENDFRNVVFDYMDDDDYADMKQVAKHFDVPLSVAKTFGRQLNLIQS
jgi:Zn-dependent peptidase ImmA (M78 family)